MHIEKEFDKYTNTYLIRETEDDEELEKVVRGSFKLFSRTNCLDGVKMNQSGRKKETIKHLRNGLKLLIQ